MNRSPNIDNNSSHDKNKAHEMAEIKEEIRQNFSDSPPPSLSVSLSISEESISARSDVLSPSVQGIPKSAKLVTFRDGGESLDDKMRLVEKDTTTLTLCVDIIEEIVRSLTEAILDLFFREQADMRPHMLTPTTEDLRTIVAVPPPSVITVKKTSREDEDSPDHEKSTDESAPFTEDVRKVIVMAAPATIVAKKSPRQSSDTEEHSDDKSQSIEDESEKRSDSAPPCPFSSPTDDEGGSKSPDDKTDAVVETPVTEIIETPATERLETSVTENIIMKALQSSLPVKHEKAFEDHRIKSLDDANISVVQSSFTGNVKNKKTEPSILAKRERALDDLRSKSLDDANISVFRSSFTESIRKKFTMSFLFEPIYPRRLVDAVVLRKAHTARETRSDAMVPSSKVVTKKIGESSLTSKEPLPVEVLPDFIVSITEDYKKKILRTGPSSLGLKKSSRCRSRSLEDFRRCDLFDSSMKDARRLASSHSISMVSLTIASEEKMFWDTSATNEIGSWMTHVTPPGSKTSTEKDALASVHKLPADMMEKLTARMQGGEKKKMPDWMFKFNPFASSKVSTEKDEDRAVHTLFPDNIIGKMTSSTRFVNDSSEADSK